MNWVPSHHGCNSRKGGQVLPKKMTLFLLQEAHRHLRKVASELERLAHGRGKTKVLGQLGAALENKHCTVAGVRAFLRDFERLQHANEPLVLTFGVNTYDLLCSGTLPSEVPRQYPWLCDWLELDLVKRLRSVVTTPFHYTQPSERSGDTLSVRIVFPGLNEEELDHLDFCWWEILEAGTFWDIFEQSYGDAFPKLPMHEYFGNLGESTE